jgi:hypothetical protein
MTRKTYTTILVCSMKHHSHLLYTIGEHDLQVEFIDLSRMVELHKTEEDIPEPIPIEAPPLLDLIISTLHEEQRQTQGKSAQLAVRDLAQNIGNISMEELLSVARIGHEIGSIKLDESSKPKTIGLPGAPPLLMTVSQGRPKVPPPPQHRPATKDDVVKYMSASAPHIRVITLAKHIRRQQLSTPNWEKLITDMCGRNLVVGGGKKKDKWVRIHSHKLVNTCALCRDGLYK